MSLCLGQFPELQDAWHRFSKTEMKERSTKPVVDWGPEPDIMCSSPNLICKCCARSIVDIIIRILTTWQSVWNLGNFAMGILATLSQLRTLSGDVLWRQHAEHCSTLIYLTTAWLKLTDGMNLVFDILAPCTTYVQKKHLILFSM